MKRVHSPNGWTHRFTLMHLDMKMTVKRLLGARHEASWAGTPLVRSWRNEFREVKWLLLAFENKKFTLKYSFSDLVVYQDDYVLMSFARKQASISQFSSSRRGQRASYLWVQLLSQVRATELWEIFISRTKEENNLLWDTSRQMVRLNYRSLFIWFWNYPSCYWQWPPTKEKSNEFWKSCISFSKIGVGWS